MFKSYDNQIKESKPTQGFVPCNNCGNPVFVTLPFVGCVFCSSCQRAGNVTYSAGTEQFVFETER